MKKLLLIPTLAASVVAPIIATTSCSKPIEWIQWDFAKDLKYVHDEIKPLDKTVKPKDAIKQFIDLIKQDKNNLVYDYFLNLSKTWQKIEKEVKIREFLFSLKINDITFANEDSILVSYEAKLDQDYTHYWEDDTYNIYESHYSIVCENIPLQIKYVDDPTPHWRIATPIDGLGIDDEMKEILLKDKKFHITGSHYYATKDEKGIGQTIFDPACDYSCKTIEEKWEDLGKAQLIATSYKSMAHELYYLQNISSPQGE